MADAGAAIVIADRDLTAQRLSAEVARLFSDRADLAAMANASLSIARPDATACVANELRTAGRRR
jgi:UDP-N-acetylglucosamine:LPS N-acetylglucosamine transferase